MQVDSSLGTSVKYTYGVSARINVVAYCVSALLSLKGSLEQCGPSQ